MDNFIVITVNTVFPKLNEKNILITYLKRLVNFLKLTIFISIDERVVIEQLTMSNNMDLVNLLFLLLPYINSECDTTQLSSLNDLYISKNKDKYIYSNLQYNRCKYNKYQIEEVSFNIDHLEQNYLLLIDTIRRMYNKLHVNFYNIIPFDPNNIDYIRYNTINDLLNKKYKYYPIEEFEHIYPLLIKNNNNNSLSIDDIYNVISVNLTDQLFKYQWGFIYNKQLKYQWGFSDILVFDILSKLVSNKLSDSDIPNFMKNIPIEIIYIINAFINNKYDYNTKDIDQYTNNILNKYTKDIDYIIIYNEIYNAVNEYNNSVYKRLQNKNFFTVLFTYSHNLCSNDGTKQTRYPLYWSSLSVSQKNEFINKIHNLPDDFKKLLIDTIIAILNQNGLLTKWIPAFNITDKINKGETEGLTIQENVNILNIFKSNSMNYYASREAYDPDLYKKLIDKDNNWYLQYAMNWVSQIGFFHKYINNRVIFITGATGVGKSTQMPKLLLYAGMAVDFKMSHKVVCTQPRRNPTIENSKRVSKEMLLDIKRDQTEEEKNKIEYIDNKKIVKTEEEKKELKNTNNYIVQFQHKEESHIKDTGFFLRFVTDGLLIEELISNPLLKKKKDNLFLLENIYDIVVIDEAHEHNPNMDMILTLMKHVAHYNNTIKLVIISATMDDDEPVYRRYYRHINDNKNYPLNTWIRDKKIDRINVDRRIHISPWKGTTKYVIKEVYSPIKLLEDQIETQDLDQNITKQEMEQAREQEREQEREQDREQDREREKELEELKKKNSPEYKQTREIIKILNSIKSVQGNILIFQPGKKQIDEITDIIDKEVNYKSTHSIIPFYREGKYNEQQVIEDELKKLKKENKYGIIIATNIAEASITLSELRNVIDTGTQKVNIYDFVSRTSKLVTKLISESSRLQRKGRTGRKNPGTVYYLYEKDTMVLNKIDYKFAIQNIYKELYKFLYSNPYSKDKKGITPMLYDKIDPNFVNILDPNNNLEVREDIKNIFKESFYLQDAYYSYLGTENISFLSPEKIWETGFNLKTIVDEYGSFWIVHPEEPFLIRDITGKIINIKKNKNITFNKEKNKVSSNKIISFVKLLTDYYYIFEYNKQYFKTSFGVAVFNLERHISRSPIELELEYLRTIIYGQGLGIQDKIIEIISLKNAINKFPNDVVTGEKIDDKYKMHYNEFKNMLKSVKTDSSDILILLKVVSFINNYDKIFNKIKDKIFNKNKKENTLQKSKIFEILDKETDIKTICESKFIKYDFVKNYIYNILTITNVVKDFNKNDISIIVDHVKSQVNTSLDTNNKISFCLASNFLYNVVRKINNTDNKYISVILPSTTNIYKIDYYKTLVNPNMLSGYVLYMSNEDNLLILHSIDPHILLSIMAFDGESIKKYYSKNIYNISLDIKPTVDNMIRYFNNNTVKQQILLKMTNIQEETIPIKKYLLNKKFKLIL